LGPGIGIHSPKGERQNNKAGNDSINKGSIKELQLIQAYQQQKWKEQQSARTKGINAKSLDISADFSSTNNFMTTTIGGLKEQF